MNRTKIEWAQFTVNPLRARDKETGKVGHFCARISPGCKHCYASRLQSRFGTPDFSALNRDKVELFLDDAVLQRVIRRRKPATIFWCDMTDMFYEGYPDEWIDRIAATCALTPQHQHLWLTKRTERARKHLNAPHAWDYARPTGMKHIDWPLPNVFPGFSAEDQPHFDQRWSDMRHLAAAGWQVWCSYEPALGPVDMGRALGLWCAACGVGKCAVDEQGDAYCTGCREEWIDPFFSGVVAGGESGPGARPAPPEWFRSVRDQCEAAGVPFHFKQWGECMPIFHGINPSENDPKCRISDGFTFPRDQGQKIGQHMWRVGKRAAGRLLDGREHNETAWGKA